MKYKVYWDNGGDACGTFPEEYDTYEDAQHAGENWEAEMGDGYISDVIEYDDGDEEEYDGFNPIQMGWVDQYGRP